MIKGDYGLLKRINTKGIMTVNDTWTNLYKSKRGNK